MQRVTFGMGNITLTLRCYQAGFEHMIKDSLVVENMRILALLDVYSCYVIFKNSPRKSTQNLSLRHTIIDQ